MANNEKMKHAYLLIINGNFKIINKLIEFFDDSDNDFYIMVDKKVKLKFEDIITYQPKESKVYEIPRLEVNWGGKHNILGIMRLLKAAVASGYDYYHFMQGADFPIKSKRQIADFYAQNKGKEFVEFCPAWYELAHDKYDLIHLFVNFRFYRGNRWWLHIDRICAETLGKIGIRYSEGTKYSGSAVWSITNDFATYLVERERTIIKRCRFARLPEEVFFQDALMQSEFKDNVYSFEKPNGNLYLIDWERKNNYSPRTFDESDYEMLTNADEDLLFARKFSEAVSMKVIDRLIEDL